jgi:O-antigen/teichoic acid export membrane protein
MLCTGRAGSRNSKMKQKQRSLKFNAAMNMLLTASTFVFPLITFPYVTRVLLPEGTGKVSFGNSVIAYFSMFASLGIPTYGIKACAKVRDDRKLLSKTVWEIFSINGIMTAAAYLLLFMAILIVPEFRERALLLLICSGSMLLTLMGAEWLYKAQEAYSYITIRSLIIRIISVALIFLFIRKPEDYLLYAAITVFSNAGYGILNFLNLRKRLEPGMPKGLNLRQHLRSVLVFFAMAAAINIYANLDTVMLGFMKGDAEVGYYDVAVKIKVILVNVVTAIGAVILPRASYYAENKLLKELWQIAERAAAFVVFLAVPCIVAFTILADKCIIFLSGKAYLQAVTPMRIIMPTLLFIGLSNILGIQILVPLNREKEVLYSEIVGAGVDVFLNALLIPKYGAAGAAFGTVMAELAVLLYQCMVLQQDAWNVMKRAGFLRIMLATAGAAAVLLLVRSVLAIGLILELCVLFGAYFLTYGLVLYLLRDSNVREIITLFQNKLRSGRGRK